MDERQMVTIGIVIVFFALFLILVNVLDNKSINGIKAKQVGDGQHGTARWATKQEIRRSFSSLPFEPELWRQGKNLPEIEGTVVACRGTANTTALIDTGDVHTLMVGAAGVGKTAYFLYPNIEFACASGMSFLSTDTKGDAARNYGTIAKNCYGYHVSVLDLRNPTRSDENNILHMVNKYMDEYLEDKTNLSAKAKAEKYAKITAKTIINIGGGDGNYGQNSFFYDAAEGLLSSTILLVAEFGDKNERHIVTVFKLIQDLIAKKPAKTGKDKTQMYFAELMEMLPSEHKAKWLAGKTDQHGFYIGRDKYGSNVLVDFDKRTEDKTNSNVLILGNSGQGKSHLLKLLLCDHREAGKSVLVLDPESEYQELCANLGGTYIDMMSGEYMINPLEPKAWGEAEKNIEAPEVFRKVTRLSQHISYLKDFFRAYKDFTDAEIDTIEIMLMKLYGRFGMDDGTNFDQFTAEDYPTMSDLYELIEKEFMAFDSEKKHLYTEEKLQNICLGLNSMCKGAEAKYFDGHTNIRDVEFICFGVKGLMDTNKRLKDTLLFNILSYMSNQLLGKGNTVAAIDELYLFLTNMTAIEYIRNGMKRVRKKESSFILASQNIEDFLLPEIKEFTKPLFSIPSHHFLFNAGQINPQEYMDALQLEESEFSLIRYPERGTCLYRCGNERYLLQVIAPSYKAALFGAAGGR